LSGKSQVKLLNQKSVASLINFIFLALLIGISSCSNYESKTNLKKSSKKEVYEDLLKRIVQIERRLGSGSNSTKKQDQKAPKGPIKSITFRLNTKDDRLRIYWADGSKSDLPCTKEQSIWACG
tara:strand:+ start:259 stop:627 length:369 start_codon:yes stop_codon:yes gene_type:complete